jgi:hypothetical protein
MWKCNLILLVLIVGAFGCDVQSGRFVTTGENSTALASSVGRIAIVTGYEAELARTTGTINEQNLLYIVIATPANQTHASGSSSDYARYVTTLNYSWDTELGTFAVSIPWDRQKDTVKIGGKKFDRSKGNVFLVEIGTNGVSGRQFASLGLHARFQDVLQSIQQNQVTNSSLR